jgi:hypothetical protein
MPSSEKARAPRAARAPRRAIGKTLAPTLCAGVVLAVVMAGAARVQAQQLAQGFAVERFYPAAPGGGWMVMDQLDMRGGLGGAIALSTGYALRPLRLATPGGSGHADVVSDQAFADAGGAITYDRYRLYFNVESPLIVRGASATFGPYQRVGPSADLGSNPDTISDIRLGLDARVLGGFKSPFRLGASAQLIVPSGERADYVTDGTYRAMARVLFAGDLGQLAYAGQLGVHVRPLDDSPAPGGPQGTEMLFGLAAGIKFLRGNAIAVILGPEAYGETAFRSFLGSTATGLEALLTGRVEGTADDGPQWRVKLGTGGGIQAHFGAPEWRFVLGVEVCDHHARR